MNRIFTLLLLLIFNSVYAQNKANEDLMHEGIDLREKGRYNKAIRTFEKAMINSDNHLVYYHHTLTCFRKNKIDKAYNSAIKALTINPLHTDSHLILSKIMLRKESRLKAMLPLYFFLILEPDSKRASDARQYLQNLTNNSFSDTPDQTTNIIIKMDKEDTGFITAEMMMLDYRNSLAYAKNDFSEMELFIKYSNQLFNTLWNIKSDSGFWWEFYIPFFHEMAHSGLVKPFCHHISVSVYDESISWLKENQEENLKFTTWLSSQPDQAGKP